MQDTLKIQFARSARPIVGSRPTWKIESGLILFLKMKH